MDREGGEEFPGILLLFSEGTPTMDDIRTSRADWRAGRRSRFMPMEKSLSWFDGEVRFLAFDAGLVQAARTLGFAMAAGRDLL